jgi:hypothetical protein
MKLLKWTLYVVLGTVFTLFLAGLMSDPPPPPPQDPQQLALVAARIRLEGYVCPKADVLRKAGTSHLGEDLRVECGDLWYLVTIRPEGRGMLIRPWRGVTGGS